MLECVLCLEKILCQEQISSFKMGDKNLGFESAPVRAKLLIDGFLKSEIFSNWFSPFKADSGVLKGKLQKIIDAFYTHSVYIYLF